MSSFKTTQFITLNHIDSSQINIFSIIPHNQPHFLKIHYSARALGEEFYSFFFC